MAHDIMPEFLKGVPVFYLCIFNLFSCHTKGSVIKSVSHAGMAELADAPDLGSGGQPRAGSSPVARTVRSFGVTDGLFLFYRDKNTDF